MTTGDELPPSTQWQAAESRLYPLIVSDPDLYEVAVGLVVEVRDVLRAQCPNVSALSQVAAADILAQCPSASAVREQGFDPRTAFDAARAQRLRELSEPGPTG